MINHLHPLWQRLPHKLRGRLYEAATGLLTREAVWTPATPRKPTSPLTVVGALGAPSGLGEMARLILRGAIATGMHVAAADLSASLMQKNVVPVAALPPAAVGPGTILLAVQPPNVAHALARLGRGLLKDKLLIGCWAWELELVPDAWRRQVRLVHAVAAPSLFCRDAFARAFDRPALLLPLPLAMNPIRTRAPRRGPVRFAAALDLGSTEARKNPIGLLDAFDRAFDADTGTTLKLKVRDASFDPATMHRIRGLVAARGGRVVLEVADLSPAEMEAWWEDVDVLVSLHRSEGLGLWPAEAMLRGIPVVSTDWSATREFIDDSNGWPVRSVLTDVTDASGRYEIDGARWAEPDPQAAAQAMRSASDRSVVEIKGAAARNTILKRFSNETFIDHLLGQTFDRVQIRS